MRLINSLKCSLGQWFNVVNSQTNHADEWAKKLLSGEQDKLHPVDPLTGEEISNRPLDYLAASEFPGDIVTKSEKTANYDDLWVPKQDSQERKLLESIGITTDKHSPCLCDNKYYRDCPPAIECTTTTYEGTVVNNNGMPKTTTLLSGDESVKPSSIMASKIVADTNNKDEIKPSVVTHQKILLPGYNEQASNYYNPKVDGDIQKLNNYIGQVKLRIPVVLPDLTMTATGAKQSLSLAGIPIDNQPMPMFKYKKYIQIGMKPQTQMVPMTTTIISPRLVSSR